MVQHTNTMPSLRPCPWFSIRIQSAFIKTMPCHGSAYEYNRPSLRQCHAMSWFSIRIQSAFIETMSCHAMVQHTNTTLRQCHAMSWFSIRIQSAFIKTMSCHVPSLPSLLSNYSRCHTNLHSV